MHPMDLVKEMNLFELIKEFSQKYKSSLLHNFTIFLDIEKDDENINMIDVKQDEKDIINYCNKLFYQLFITNESIKSLEYTISPPFVLENLDKKIYISCPYYDNSKLKIAPCLPIAIYNDNLKIFLASISSQTLFIIVAESTDIFFPIFQFGCFVASLIVIFLNLF